MVVDLATTTTQIEFGSLVGISQQAVSDLMFRGVLKDGDPVGRWLLDYCEHMRGVAAGRGGDDGVELTAARARLAKEQADKIAMQNAVTRGELAPAPLLEYTLARTGTKVTRILDTIPGLLRRRLPQLGADDVAAVAAVIAKARSAVAAMRLVDVGAEDDSDEVLDGAGEERTA